MSLSLIESEGTEIQVPEATSMEALARAEIDIQVATAKRHPRSFERFLRQAQSMISVSPQVAETCRYVLPARKGSNERISGPSVRMAEIAASSWGNLRIVGRIVAEEAEQVVAQGVCHDLESNVAYAVEVRRRITTRTGQRYSSDMINTTANAAIAIATRNATLKVIPKSFIQVLEDHAIAVARGDEKTLPQRVDAAIGLLASKGIGEAKVFKTLGITGRADMSVDHLLTLRGYIQATRDGHATLEEIFADPEQPTAPKAKGSAALAERLAATPAAPSAHVAIVEPSGQIRDTEGGNDD